MSFRKHLGRGLAAFAMCGAAAIALPANAADHLDGGAAAADPSSDINDVFAFMNGDNLVLSMTVHPVAEFDTTFSDQVQFAFHVNSHAGFLQPAASERTVICEFDAAQMLQCWVAGADNETLDYLMGDASAAEGTSNDAGSMRAFAGLRADPFYFHLQGFIDARNIVISEVTNGNVDVLTNATACPELTNGQLDALADALTATGPGAQDLNFFKDLNTLSIVLEIDKSLFVDETNPYVTVWASTHAKPAN